MSAAARSRLYAALVAVATLVAAVFVVTRVHLDPDIAGLLPDRGAAAALARYARAFGGGDPGLVLIEGPVASDVEAAASALVASARARLSLGRAYDRVALATDLPPSAWFLLADAPRFDALAAALEPAAMRGRLRDTRALLLAPGGGAFSSAIARDPLRLAQLATEGRAAPGDQPVRPDGQLANGNGLARLVVIEPRGNALRSDDARTFITDVERAIEPVHARYPAVTFRVAGGHAIAAATESLLRRDITLSSLLALVLASLAFAVSFRVPRALAAVIPPLAAGALVTTGLAAFFTSGLSAIATAFASVVLGVGMDSGVHVYAAVQHAIAQGSANPATDARRRTARPVLAAALVAGSAFACLAMSQIGAVRQLGVLSAAGEIVTALTILALTPQAAAWLERRRARPFEIHSPAWATSLGAMSRSPRTRLAFFTLWALPFVVLAFGGVPHAMVGLTSIRPEGLAPFAAYDTIAERFGLPSELPWVVIVRDGNEPRARARADAIADGLAASHDLVASFDTLSTWSPSPATRALRRAHRDALDLPAHAVDLERALRDEGLAPARFTSALDDLRTPASDVDTSSIEATLATRYVARLGAETLIASYVRPIAGREEALRKHLAALDPAADFTGYPALEPALRASLAADFPRAGGLALALLVASLALTLRRPREVAVAGLVIACEIAAVLALMRVFGIPLHVYDALVLPVLVGITIDEVLFVLFATRERDAADALAHEAPTLVATALTTAAGFAALGVCRFAALRHIGFVGAAGSIAGVLLALTLVPALVGRRAHESKSPTR